MTTHRPSDRPSAATVEFTYDWYERFLSELLDSGYTPADYDESLSAGEMIVRHDIDFAPRKALRMGRIEADLGIESTYFVLLTCPLYNVFYKPVRAALEELQSMGHTVGVHFSTHQYWNGEAPSAAVTERVLAEREALSGLLGDVSEAVSFHRPDEWLFRRSFEGFISTYEERFFTDIAYLGDSNQRWRDQHPLSGERPEKLQILTHPGLWGAEDADFETRLAGEVDRELGRTRRFMHEQLVDKMYNVDEFHYDTNE
ncbi:polysaccharide deacetylase family protein [Halalkalicoccus jeotgali]|uniref:Polysaccharide deacetylase n=1 Tax=Halalkalicoccus jeotgali (strain DSM 18796 / CECT 7217 / JCM 14584 / KCTC 4019 / B3) TaxID=795797 RepID=D8J5Q6_HALJB|nr:hypothetical protein [Halalkalicoccus jeotgali]ADJ13712.1 hypothetical protein HacjB3_01595 [Halalkalicoccus jeotgali B3]ELY34241.1 hypothetical protein C497_17727 [Halalkalicoccus jeotgali B3]